MATFLCQSAGRLAAPAVEGKGMDGDGLDEPDHVLRCRAGMMLVGVGKTRMKCRGLGVVVVVAAQ